jgi:hypothetical protein
MKAFSFHGNITGTLSVKRDIWNKTRFNKVLSIFKKLIIIKSSGYSDGLRAGRPDFDSRQEQASRLLLGST